MKGRKLAAGHLPEAIDHYEQALRLNPDLAEAHYNLGMALEQAGRKVPAMARYKLALQNQPDFPEAQRRLARLQGVQ
jgi:tetratricopeptide (TPR) repeat protein